MLIRELRPEMLEWRLIRLAPPLTTPGWDAGNRKRLFLGVGYPSWHVLQLSVIEREYLDQNPCRRPWLVRRGMICFIVALMAVL